MTDENEEKKTGTIDIGDLFKTRSDAPEEPPAGPEPPASEGPPAPEGPPVEATPPPEGSADAAPGEGGGGGPAMKPVPDEMTEPADSGTSMDELESELMSMDDLAPVDGGGVVQPVDEPPAAEQPAMQPVDEPPAEEPPAASPGEEALQKKLEAVETVLRAKGFPEERIEAVKDMVRKQPPPEKFAEPGPEPPGETEPEEAEEVPEEPMEEPTFLEPEGGGETPPAVDAQEVPPQEEAPPEGVAEADIGDMFTTGAPPEPAADTPPAAPPSSGGMKPVDPALLEKLMAEQEGQQ